MSDYQIEGYEALSDNYDDIDEDGIYFYIDTEKEINTFVILYEKICDSDGEQIENNQSDIQIEAGETPVDTNSNNQPADDSVEDSEMLYDKPKEDESKSTDSDSQPPGTSSYTDATGETSTATNTVESLL